MTTEDQTPIILWFRQRPAPGRQSGPEPRRTPAGGRSCRSTSSTKVRAVRPIGGGVPVVARQVAAGAGGQRSRSAARRLILRRGDSRSRAASPDRARRAPTCVFMNRLFEPDAWAATPTSPTASRPRVSRCKGFNGALLARAGVGAERLGRAVQGLHPFLKALLARPRPPPHTTGPRSLAGRAEAGQRRHRRLGPASDRSRTGRGASTGRPARPGRRRP